MTAQDIIFIGAPVDSGKDRKGCIMGPDAYRTAGLEDTLAGLGCTVIDNGNLTAEQTEIPDHDHLVALPQTVGWTRTLHAAAVEAAPKGLPIFLGGDHSLALGTVTGIADHAASVGKPLFVLWLDAHTDYHTPDTTSSGNLHGTPVAYFTGRDGFDAFPAVNNPVPTANICMMGLRSVDPEEHAALADTEMHIADMRAIDEFGIRAPLAHFLDRVAAADGLLHVSLDVDFLDPDIAPAVGTTVPGGATLREAHLIMEMLHDSGRVTSLDLVELNPFMDERGRTASLMVDLTASLMGRRVFDRPTRSFV
ncbi:arginase [Octadecabacter sp. 1_MG-2023]|uniref:arginase n=1 Tax=unclassified Octadecabacter TaxID=196158 RepID=UPI001C09CCB2|nr:MULTISPECIES: arginase [unclassified Octadecabacter]MBU2993238.1 arginase [Octadecabacter sp. B2R22]MDO6733307.1 arginase [Octadecabacter sp. 1_MG-2023]